MVAKNDADRVEEALGDLEGRVLSDRYHVVTVVSAGANTIIADAYDAEADQPVTCKIVRPELALDAEFRHEFARRAEIATALVQPNIATVIDWGEVDLGDQTTVFWVVEHLGGGSLRDLFDRGRLLEPSQALVVGLEACRALDAAHQRGIAHTELTPSKLVFGDDRRLRIVDFGFAELLGRAAWNEPATVPTHVARYASPEQALGVEVGTKSDVYALALSLLEAVTGSVPFASDSTVATLTARVDKLMPVSADLGSLASVLERAGRPEPDDRSTAAEFARGLVQAAERLPRPDPIPIVAGGLFDTSAMRRPDDPTGGIARPESLPPDDAAPVVDGPVSDTAGPATEVPASDVLATDRPGSDVPGADDVLASDTATSGSAPAPEVSSPSDPTSPAAAATVDQSPSQPDATLAEPAAGDRTLIVLADAADGPGVSGPQPGAGSFDRAAAVHDAPTATTLTPAADTQRTEQMPVAPLPPPQPREVYDDERPRRRTGVIVALSLFVLAGLAALAFAGSLLLRTKSYEVPDLAGVQEAVALNEVAGNGWDIVFEYERSDEQPVENTVIGTFPGPGVVLDEGEEFRIFVSQGPLFRTLPDVAGLTVADAQARLDELQLSSFVDSEEFDEDLVGGTVISWVVRGDAARVAGDEVLPGTTIALTVSKGPAPRVVPDVVGLTLDGAQAAAGAVQLSVVAGEDVFSDDVPVGVIVSQDVAPGSELPRGESFTVSRSKGLDLIELPELEGLSYTEAQRVLTDAGFTIGSLLGTTDGTFESITIDAESIDGLYRRGTTVDLIFL